MKQQLMQAKRKSSLGSMTKEIEKKVEKQMV